MNANALLLSAYDARSHRLWRQRLTRMFPGIRWHQLTLPPRNFNWRIRSNSLQWALSNRQELTAAYDFLLATSMVDLSSLRGFIPHLASIPTIVYFHENQFAYPDNLQRQENIEPLIVPLYSALCADRIVFNSRYNRLTFLEGVRSLFKKLPDNIPATAIEKLETSTVIPVPVSILETSQTNRKSADCLELVWNHRWEYDKGPELLLTIVEQIAADSLPLRLHIVGESFRQSPAAFGRVQQLLESHTQALGIGNAEFGYIDDEASYYQLLANCDAVLSTARHDFQGLAVQEACLAGCSPLAPNDLAYVEYLPEQFLYDNNGSDKEIAQRVVMQLKQWLQLKQANRSLPKVDLSKYGEDALISSYSELFNSLI